MLRARRSRRARRAACRRSSPRSGFAPTTPATAASPRPACGRRRRRATTGSTVVVEQRRRLRAARRPPSPARRATARCRHLRLAVARRDADLRLGQRRDDGERAPTSTARAGAGDGARVAGAACRWSSCCVGTAIGLIVVAAAGSVVAAHQVSGAARPARGSTDAGPARRRRADRPRPAPRRPLGSRRRPACVSATTPGRRQPARRDRAGERRAPAVVALSFSTDAGDAPTPSTTASGSAFAFATARSRSSSARATGRRSAIRQTLVVTVVQRRPARRRGRARRRSAPEPCAAGSTTCPPRQQIRGYAISVAGRSAIDPRRRSLAAQQRSRPQRHRRRQLRGMNAMSQRSPFARSPRRSLAPARRRRALRHRHALLRDGARGRRRASQRRRRGAALGQRAARRHRPSKPPKPGLEWALARINDPARIGVDCLPSADAAARSFRERMVRIDVADRGDLAPLHLEDDAGTPVAAAGRLRARRERLDAAAARRTAVPTCRRPAAARSRRPSSSSSPPSTRADVVRVVATGCTRAGSGTESARQAPTPDTRRRRASKRRGRCCRRCARCRRPR